MREAGFLSGPDRPDDPHAAVAQQNGRPPAAALPSEVPLTESQMEVWLSARLSDEASCAFNESFTLEMRGV